MLSFIGVTIFVVLGCHIQHIQQDRIFTAITFAQSISSVYQNTTENEPVWFLTGGVKNALTEHIGAEASQMEKSLMKVNINNVVLDTHAKNTAENFLNLKLWIKNLSNSNINVIITTSSFHQKRAEKIFKGIFYDLDVVPHWNLGKASCSYCESDEYIHIRNVENDVKTALYK